LQWLIWVNIRRWDVLDDRVKQRQIQIPTRQDPGTP